MYKDLRSKAKNGNQFPIQFNDIVHQVNELNIKMGFPDQRVRIHFKNHKDIQTNPLKVMRFYPNDFISIFSIPQEQIGRVTKEMILFGLNLFRDHQDKGAYSRTKDLYYQFDLDLIKNEAIFTKTIVHLKMTFEYNNRPVNRSTYKILKKENQILFKKRFPR